MKNLADTEWTVARLCGACGSINMRLSHCPKCGGFVQDVAAEVFARGLAKGDFTGEHKPLEETFRQIEAGHVARIAESLEEIATKLPSERERFSLGALEDQVEEMAKLQIKHDALLKARVKS